MLVATFQGQPPGAASPSLYLGDTQRSGWIWLRNARDVKRGRIVKREVEDGDDRIQPQTVAKDMGELLKSSHKDQAVVSGGKSDMSLS